MHKLIILIEKLEDSETFEAGWPAFLQYAEQMPGLRQEVTSRVSEKIYGSYECALTHELYFDDRDSAYQALNSPAGQNAGRTLQLITEGRMTLLFAEHHADTIEHIQRSAEESAESLEDPDA